jgi:hypothetical protein
MNVEDAHDQKDGARADSAATAGKDVAWGVGWAASNVLQVNGVNRIWLWKGYKTLQYAVCHATFTG